MCVGGGGGVEGVMKALFLVIDEFQRGPYRLPGEATGHEGTIVSREGPYQHF